MLSPNGKGAYGGDDAMASDGIVNDTCTEVDDDGAIFTGFGIKDGFEDGNARVEDFLRFHASTVQNGLHGLVRGAWSGELKDIGYEVGAHHA